MASLKKLGIDQVNLVGKRVLIRIDLNVTINNGRVTNWRRLIESIPTIKYCLEKGAAIILISHVGRPGGRFQPVLSLKPMADELTKRLGHKVEFIRDCVGSYVEQRCNDLTPGEIVLLENLRFHPEEQGDGVSKEAVTRFRRFLSSLANVYVQDAFGAVHRPHSSILGIDIPQRAAGLLMMKELDVFGEALGDPSRPFLAIVGGDDLRKKILLIKHLVTKVDGLIIAGGPSFTFKKVIQNIPVGSSRVCEDLEEEVKEIMRIAEEHNTQIHFPIDYLVADRVSFDASIEHADDSTGVPIGMMALDIGFRSREVFCGLIHEASTIIWNGPMGAFEFGKFAAGTKAIMDALVEVATAGSTVIVCGSDTCEACKIWGTEDKITHLSTGDAVSTLLLSGQSLPGVEALSPHPLENYEKSSRRKAEGIVIDDAVKDRITTKRKQIIEAGEEFKYFVAVDIGGTNTRVVFGFPDSEYFTITKYQASDVPTLINGLSDISEQVKECVDHMKSSGAVVDVAGPVSDGGQKVELTNYSGASASRFLSTSELPPFLFPQGCTRFVNDLEAACFGLMKLDSLGEIDKYFCALAEDDGSSSSPQNDKKKNEKKKASLISGRTYAVVAVGTGLGSGVIKYKDGKLHEVVPLEAGHAMVSPIPPSSPYRAFNEEVIDYLSGRLYEGGNGIEWEDVCSGRGIANCFAAIEYLKTGNEVPLQRHAPVIAGRALQAQRAREHSIRKNSSLLSALKSSDHDPAALNNSPSDPAHRAISHIHHLPGPMTYAHDSLKTHYIYLARFSQELAITFKADVVFWAGDNQVYNQNFVTAIAKDLRDTFNNHPKSTWVNNVPIYTQSESVNINLLGALKVAQTIGTEPPSPAGKDSN